MTAEQFIASKASEAVKALYGADVAPEQMQVQVTRKEFEGDFTLVVFPLLFLGYYKKCNNSQHYLMHVTKSKHFANANRRAITSI